MGWRQLESSRRPEIVCVGPILVMLRHSVFGSGLTLSAYGKNLTNKFYFVGGLAQGGAFGINGAAMGVPRMYGVQASYEF